MLAGMDQGFSRGGVQPQRDLLFGQLFLNRGEASPKFNFVDPPEHTLFPCEIWVASFGGHHSFSRIFYMYRTWRGMFVECIFLRIWWFRQENQIGKHRMFYTFPNQAGFGNPKREAKCTDPQFKYWSSLIKSRRKTLVILKQHELHKGSLVIEEVNKMHVNWMRKLYRPPI